MLCALSPHLRPYLSQNYLGMAAISKVGLESHSSLCVSLAEPGRQAVGLLRLILRRSGPPPPPPLSPIPQDFASGPQLYDNGRVTLLETLLEGRVRGSFPRLRRASGCRRLKPDSLRTAFELPRRWGFPGRISKMMLETFQSCTPLIDGWKLGRFSMRAHILWVIIELLLEG